ncbi:MAG: UDP-3-O-(3-hydroxymyristoyl)glucosamine N-acyltransferase [Acidiferrobacterales bacterium]
MAISIRELAEMCGADILGDNPQQTICSAASIEEAGANQIAFLSSAKYACRLKTTMAGAVLVQRGAPDVDANVTTCLLAVDDPEIAFIACLNRLYPQRKGEGTLSVKADIDASAIIGKNTRVEAFSSVGAHTMIGDNCCIKSGCHIGDGVTLGDNCVLYPNVVLYDGVRLGNNVILHAGAVIGSDGFGYKFRNGEHVKFPQVGTAVIESNVEIGANSCIDRAALWETRVGEGTKIDNQVHIAHNVQIGARSLLCGQVGIGGSTVIKDHVTLASQCGVADHVTVGSQVTVCARTGVTKDVGDKDEVMGFPAANRREVLHEMAALRRLAGNQKAIEELVQLLPMLRSIC